MLDLDDTHGCEDILCHQCSNLQINVRDIYYPSRVEMVRDLHVHSYYRQSRERDSNCTLFLGTNQNNMEQSRTDDTICAGSRQMAIPDDRSGTSAGKQPSGFSQATRPASFKEGDTKRVIRNKPRRLRQSHLKLIISPGQSSTVYQNTPEMDARLDTDGGEPEESHRRCECKRSSSCKCNNGRRHTATDTISANSQTSPAEKWKSARLAGLLLRFMADHFSWNYGKNNQDEQDSDRRLRDGSQLAENSTR